MDMTNFERDFKQLRIASHFDHIYNWQHDIPFFPINVEISPVSYCNQRCKYCYTSALDYPHEKIESDIFLKLIDELAHVGVKAVRFQGTGEPTLHPSLGKAICKAGNQGMRVSLTTNGVLFNNTFCQSTLEHIYMTRFSVLDSSPKRYAKFHGVQEKQWHTIVKNIENAANNKAQNNFNNYMHATVYIEDDNYLDIPDICIFCKNLGIDYVVLSAATYTCTTPSKDQERFNFLDGDPHYIEKLKQELLAIEDDSFKIQHNLDDRLCFEQIDTQKKLQCPGTNFYTMLSASGDVYPCYRFWGDKDHSLGNIYNNTFSEIWTSKHRTDSINKLGEHNYSNQCAVCAHSRINSYLNSIANSSEFVNFL